jgi:hypothetical protein
MEHSLPVEELLYEEEGTTLDFKREQYKYSGASDYEKSELLKDILAFSNAWRGGDAYLLIGVEEVKGGKSLVIGIEEELDDAQLQQFVNGKTQRPIDFEYRTVLVEGKKVGVIRIPVQTRPFYIAKDYGKLKRNVVYIRRGSSTGEANPDEIRDMGRADVGDQREIPSLYFEFADLEKRLPLGNSVSFHVTLLDIPALKEIPDYTEPREFGPLGLTSLSIGHVNSSYYKDMVKYYYVLKKSSALAFSLRNESTILVTDIRVELILKKIDKKFTLFEEKRFPKYPEAHYDFIRNIKPLAEQLAESRGKSISLQDLGDIYRVEVFFEKVQPRQTVFSSEVIYISSNSSFSSSAKVPIYADNIPLPIEQELLVSCEVSNEDGALERIEEIHNQNLLTKYSS